eukprot:CAMPEP_0119415402 /NCGR_PEP_ID=MMETSP1335-20130426/9090_1 /TAXON_ID=259385 /ORGANISM="Chrysoculter rhomboideus, Strain RCC1486" /LENGTH=45 /DNA_ID= /DNA_START= /DNA_END= /DNA_ORIENTATION=
MTSCMRVEHEPCSATSDESANLGNTTRPARSAHAMSDSATSTTRA